MNRGSSLIELMVALTIASILLLGLYFMTAISSKKYTDLREGYLCMQSIRNTIVHLNHDLVQCAYLLPQDMKVMCQDNELFIAGLPVTSRHSGLEITGSPPYYSKILSCSESAMRLDTIDIDHDSTPDFWADLGIITGTGAYTINHGYSRGNTRIALCSSVRPQAGERAVPAIHYELKDDGLYRNSQLLAENIGVFTASFDSHKIQVYLKAIYNETQRELQFAYTLQ